MHMQAEAVVSDMRINLALNLVLREEVLVEKCLGEFWSIADCICIFSFYKGSFKSIDCTC
jgi:hypothetical protein